MIRTLVLLLLLIGIPVAAQASDGLITLKSPHTVPQTADRLEKALRDKGMKIFSRIDHAAGAARAGLTLRPTVLILFGNPKIGSKLMQCDQKTAIDLPMKALVYQDDSGTTWLSYNSPAWLASRHNLAACQPVLDKVGKALAGFAASATAP